jgi:hypothetical protein
MNAYRGKGAFYLRNRGMGSPTVDQFFVDIPELLKLERFKDRMNNAFSRHLPASAGIIISPDDADSQAIAAQAQSWIKAHTNKDVPCLTSKDLPDEAKLKSGESVIIAIGAIETGTQIQAIDRALRNPCGSSPRVYIVGVSKHQNLPSVQNVIKDLQFSGTSNAHGVVLLEQMTLPGREEALAWVNEWTFLSEFVDPLKSPPPEFPDELLKEFCSRMSLVEGLPQKDLSGFFWNSSLGSALRLRDTFAFWDFPSGKAAQADVIVTIGSILQSLREGQNTKLRQSAFHHSVISPSMFSRYNDGIIQASLLRCALPREIDYSGSDHLSQRMASLLRELFKETDSDTGEAVPEFLMALAMGRLKLKRQDACCALETLVSANQSLQQLRDLCVRRIGSEA